MRNRRKIRIAAIAICVSLAPAIVPAVAAANPLLSGYGGPGQGQQAILGATLIGGGSSGGGSSAGGAPASLAVPGSAPVTTLTGGKRAGARSAHAGYRRSDHASKTPSGAYRSPTAVGGASPATGASGGALGLSLTDLLYILLALGGLAFVAVLTRGLAKHGNALKG